MKMNWSMTALAAILVLTKWGAGNLWAQESATAPAVLHIQQTTTTSAPLSPTFLTMYHVLDSAKSPAEALALTGTISLKNFSPNFSQILWLLVYWQGECPAHDINLAHSPGILWSDIIKNPSQSTTTFPINLAFPNPVPITGCIGLYYGGGSVLVKSKVTMTADLNLTYRPVTTPNPNTVLDLSGEYCFGQNWGCQNTTEIEGEVFAVPTKMTSAGHLLEIYGNISDSTFDGTSGFGPLPTASWGASNDFYLLPGGCGIFEANLNGQGVPNPVPLSTLQSWLPKDALHLSSLPLVDRVSPGGSSEAPLQGQVETIFSAPLQVNAGDCMLVIYGRTGNGATDDETQVHALMGP
jgi:hypothetical protein